MLGPEHPHTLTSMNNLAYCAATTAGSMQRLRAMHRQVLELQSAGAGARASGHPDQHEQPGV